MQQRTRGVLLTVVLAVVAAVIASRLMRPASFGEGASERPAQTAAARPVSRSTPAPAPGHAVAARAPVRTHVDPARRAELKRLIEAAGHDAPRAAGSAGKAGAATETAGAGVNPAPGTGPARRTDSVEEYARFIHERLRDDFVPMANVCYDELRSRSPGAAGTVIMDFKIIGRASLGSLVDSAEVKHESTLRDATLEECLRNSFLSVYFDSPPVGVQATLNYPFVFGGDAGSIAEHEIHMRDRRGETAR
jgi:hypothetical protein